MLQEQVARINALAEQTPGEVGSYSLRDRALQKLLNKDGGVRLALCWGYETQNSVIYAMLRAFAAGYDEVRHNEVDKKYETDYTETP